MKILRLIMIKYNTNERQFIPNFKKCKVLTSEIKITIQCNCISIFYLTDSLHTLSNEISVSKQHWKMTQSLNTGLIFNA